MSNKNEFAFPVFDQKGECLPGGAGLSKLEYAAIHIVAGMFGSGRYAPNQNEAIAEIAVNVAKLTLQKCNQ